MDPTATTSDQLAGEVESLADALGPHMIRSAAVLREAARRLRTLPDKS